MGLREDAIASAKKPRKTKAIEGKPWGIEGLHILKINGRERDQYQADLVARSNDKGRITNPVGWVAKVVVMFACDEHGQRIFKDSDASDLNEGDPDDLDMVFSAFLEFNEMRREDEEAIEGNSEGEDGNGSLPASHMSLESKALSECLIG